MLLRIEVVSGAGKKTLLQFRPETAARAPELNAKKMNAKRPMKETELCIFIDQRDITRKRFSRCD